MKLLRWLLIPIVPIYDLITRIRNFAYDHNWLKSTSFPLPVIAVGNLSVGGTGKTPMVEYLIRLLRDDFKVATLSRGYGRKTSGFVLANDQSDAITIGDEPFQFYSKYKDVTVAVDEQRVRGISQLLKLSNPPEVIILDDAFQHRKVKAGLYILLTDFNNMYLDDLLLPTGNLREAKKGANRSDLIVVTKCPHELSDIDKNHIVDRINPLPSQKVFFSKIVYADKIIGTNEELSIDQLKSKRFTLVTGIANPEPLIEFLVNKGLEFEHLAFKDHHNYTAEEIANLSGKDLILTTEKDFARLKGVPQNLYFLPIRIEFDKKELFNESILKYSKSTL
ncbi:tetraacyldisaccharide 4'-kinase [Aegicerativicinus sediminis]